MRVKGSGTSFATGYYPELHFSSGLCVNYISPTKVRVKVGTSHPIIFLTAMKECFI